MMNKELKEFLKTVQEIENGEMTVYIGMGRVEKLLSIIRIQDEFIPNQTRNLLAKELSSILKGDK